MECRSRPMLSPILLFHIRCRGFYNLYHIWAHHGSSSSFNSRLNASQLGLVGSLAVEWDAYILDLYHANIRISDGDDRLLWTWNTEDSSISAQQAYLALCSKSMCIRQWWHVQVWKWCIPPKVRIFIWLLLEEKILIWSNLQKRGFTGPGICSLCHQEAETLVHLFILCPFTVSVCRFMGDPFTPILFDQHSTFQTWFKGIFSYDKYLGVLACLLTWSIWKTRN